MRVRGRLTSSGFRHFRSDYPGSSSCMSTKVGEIYSIVNRWRVPHLLTHKTSSQKTSPPPNPGRFTYLSGSPEKSRSWWSNHAPSPGGHTRQASETIPVRIMAICRGTLAYGLLRGNSSHATWSPGYSTRIRSCRVSTSSSRDSRAS